MESGQVRKKDRRRELIPKERFISEGRGKGLCCTK